MTIEYKRIKPRKIYEEVAETLYEMIRTGKFKAGDKLDSVQQLAENFQVGRSAIREALSALRAMGLVEMRQGEGTYIKEFDAAQITFPLSTAILMNKEDVSHLVEVRKILEAGAATEAARKRTDEDLKLIENALEEMKNANGNEELGEKADLKFHLTIAKASQNPLLVNLMNHVSEMMVATMKETRRIWLYSKRTTTERLYDEHAEIYQAIKMQNCDAARDAMHNHLDAVQQVLSHYFEEKSTK